MQTRLVLGGIALFLLGCAMVVWIMLASPESPTESLDGGLPADRLRPLEDQQAALPWSIVAGFCVAGGAALVGVGMHQWRQRLLRGAT
jgi:hypothetical protein